MDAHQFPGEVQKIAALIEAARKLAAENRVIDLAPLGRRISHLCEAVRDSRPEDPAELRQSLASLIAALDQLAGTVTPKLEITSPAGDAEARVLALEAYPDPSD